MPNIGSTGGAVPAGGAAGYALTKNTATDYDANWFAVGSSKVTASGFSLGTQAASQSVFTYYAVPSICARGIVSQFTVTADSAGTYDVEVRGAGSSSGSLWLQATGITTTAYANPTVWYTENDAAAQTFYVGIRNTATASHSFTLTSLRVEKFA